MTDANLAGSQRQKEAKLPRRDWVLLPLLSLLTMLVLLASSEGVARVVWPCLLYTLDVYKRQRHTL